jgi:hypothetical protein
MASATGYYSSPQKDVLRERYTRSLIEYHASSVNRQLRYFGLPGGEAKDVGSWESCIQYVSAVDRKNAELVALDTLFPTRFPHITLRTHWGELDGIILSNRGKTRKIGGEPYRPVVGTRWEEEVTFKVWDFDLLNLDYFGPFLPGDVLDVEDPVRVRADALRMLFAKYRQDAWKPWLLLITVEASMKSAIHRASTIAYLDGVAQDASSEVRAAIARALLQHPNSTAESVLLNHATACCFIATCANAASLDVVSRGTVVYLGAHNQPMMQMAYELQPAATPLAPPNSRGRLLRSPVLQIRPSLDAPWVQLASEQLCDLEFDACAACIEFLGADHKSQILAVLSQ